MPFDRSRALPPLAALMVLLLGALGAAAASGVFTREPYLQLATPESIHVVWRTAGPIAPGVRFGPADGELDRRVAGEDIVVKVSLGEPGQPIPERWESLRTEANLRLPRLHSAPVGTFQYEARLSGLKPSTRYRYMVMDGEQPLTPADETYTFVTPPPPGTVTPIRFWALGDSGTGRQPQADVHQAMLDLVAREGRPIDFWLHLGDMAYSTGRDMEFQTRFFEMYAPSLRQWVCWPTMGNHEGATSRGSTGTGPYYDAYVVPTRGEAGGLASGTEAYYSFDHGNVHFVCLDSHDLDRRPTAAMARWLKADLEKTRADWIIAFWHHPPYTKGSHDSDRERDLIEMREYIMPIIDSGGVDLVLTGHSHIYERSMLIDGAYATPTVSENVVLDDGDGDPAGDGPYRKSQGIHPHEGTVQVVAGHGGTGLGRRGTSPVMRWTIVEHGSVLVDVYGDTLVARMINRNGTIRDTFSMVKRGAVQHARIALPWRPPAYEPPERSVRSRATPAIDHRILIPRHAEWRYLAGEHPRGRDWTRLEFDDSQWKTGRTAMGFGDGEFGTDLGSLRGSRASVYLRHEFVIEQKDRLTEVGLLMDYRDAFIAYVNGRELGRSGVGRSSGRNAQDIRRREETGDAYFGVRDFSAFRDGVNVLAIEVHSAPGNDLDFRVDPVLVVED